MSTYSLLLSLLFTPFATVNARTCCCAAFTYEACEAAWDESKHRCVWRERQPFGPSIGEKGVCRTQQWIEIQESNNEHHPFHTTSTSESSIESIPFISIPKNRFGGSNIDDFVVAAHEADPANPDNYDWPNICFTEEAMELPCNAMDEEKITAQFVQVGHMQHLGKTLSVSAVSIIITLIAFIAFVVGLSVYWQGKKDETLNEYALDDIEVSVVPSYSTFAENGGKNDDTA